MIQIQHICKQYTTGKLIQQALDDVSLNLRDNEFVAILGPSGSGKTTLLNIIGGLDCYDSGNLIINGISTQKYKDRDWDSYRNHTIGFVFQSYNLIPHQTILSNVELALTISGVDRAERKKRAIRALEQVGLGEQVEKRPNQLSGGQMQRVAIARALVNDPDILLADEPTGALDSETSIQVMDLLKEVAKDRLVVMVTHNPELAEEYATRIVRLKDGKICSDSDPLEVDETALEAPKYENMGKASMSFLTTLLLSFNNLRTKKARTFLTSFAGSIGIIGIALILSMSTGVNDYIQSVEEETLSEYPLQIDSMGVNTAAMLAANAAGGNSGEGDENNEKDEEKSTADTAGKGEKPVRVLQMVSNMFSTVNSNDLKSLKTYLDGSKEVKEAAKAVEYKYSVVPQIYRQDPEDDSVRQVHPDQSFQVMGISSSASSNSMISSMMSTDVFFSLPEQADLYEKQYDVKAGRWPEKYNECVVVLSQNGGISDFMMYTLGLRDSRELEDMIRQFMEEKPVTTPAGEETYSYQDLLDVTFKLVNSTDCYQYEEQYQVWRDKTGNAAYMKELVKNGEDLKVVGVVQPSEDAKSTFLNMGIYYPASLVRHIAARAEKSEIVQQQLAEKDTDVFTNEAFSEQKNQDDFDMSSLFSIDTEALKKAFSIDAGGLSGLSYPAGSMDLSGIFAQTGGSLDLTGLVDMGDLELELPQISGEDVSEFLKNIKITATPETVNALAASLLEGYQEYYKGNTAADFTHLSDYFIAYLRTEEAQKIIRDHLKDIIGANGNYGLSGDELKSLVTEVMAGFQGFAAGKGYTDQDRFSEYLNEYLETSQASAALEHWSKANLRDAQDIEITDAQLQKLVTELTEGYQKYAEQNGYPEPSQMGAYFAEYLQTEDAARRLSEGISAMLDTDALKGQIAAALQQYMEQVFTSYSKALSKALETQVASAMQQITDQLAAAMEQVMQQAFTQVGTQLQDAFNVDGNAFAEAFSFNMTGEDLAELLASMNTAENASYEGNLKKLGYVDFAVPSSIYIYPKNFESKEKIVDLLDQYNERMEKEGKDEQVITYTDMVGLLMSSVTDIVDTISYVLIAFVAISLVVSSIMIGVITYISVLERRKEIGILRAIGASKRNISQVFNAETEIIGFCAGLLGILVTLLLLIPLNALIHHLADSSQINAVLPVVPAIVLILLSICLTWIGGLIPSKKAAKSDPVAALRSE